LPKDFFYLNR